MSSESVLCMKNIGCTFLIRKSRLRLEKIHALSHIDLKLARGESLGLIGHNGAGKSTLLLIMGQIITPTEGSLHVSPGVSSSLLSLSLGFSEALTGRENAVLGAMYMGSSRKEAEERLPLILDFAEIGEWADHPLRTYSTGMRMRLAFAVSLEMQPDILLIDETLGVGDVYFQKKSVEALRKKIGGCQSTVLVSHSIPALRELCDRIIWLHNGRIHEEGSPDKILDEYISWSSRLQKHVAGVCS